MLICMTCRRSWSIRPQRRLWGGSAHGTLKAAYTVTVGEDEMPDGLAEALRACGCKDGDSVTVVVQ